MCILVNGVITVSEQAEHAVVIAVDRNNKQVIFKNCGLFTNCIYEKHSTQVLLLLLSLYLMLTVKTKLKITIKKEIVAYIINYII